MLSVQLVTQRCPQRILFGAGDSEDILAVSGERKRVFFQDWRKSDVLEMRKEWLEIIIQREVEVYYRKAGNLQDVCTGRSCTEVPDLPSGGILARLFVSEFACSALVKYLCWNSLLLKGGFIACIWNLKGVWVLRTLRVQPCTFKP